MSLLMPLMEFVPFSANIAGFTFTVFGLSLLANDGLSALIAFVFLGTIIGFFAYGIL